MRQWDQSRYPRRQATPLTGTPLENRLEDLYSVIQIADAELVTPLWFFAAEHYLIDKKKPSKIPDYRNLEAMNQKLQNIMILHRVYRQDPGG